MLIGYLSSWISMWLACRRGKTYFFAAVMNSFFIYLFCEYFFYSYYAPSFWEKRVWYVLEGILASQLLVRLARLKKA